jgi:hypothetical protein
MAAGEDALTGLMRPPRHDFRKRTVTSRRREGDRTADICGAKCRLDQKTADAFPGNARLADFSVRRGEESFLRAIGQMHEIRNNIVKA